MSTASVQPAPEGAPGLSQAERVVNTFIDPPKAFADIKRSASWWLPFVLMALLGVAFAYVAGNRIGFERLAQQAMQQSPARAAQFEQLPAEQQQAQITNVAGYMKWSFYLNPVLSLFFFAVAALVLMAIFNFGFEAEIGYNQSLAVVVHAFLPTVLSGAILIASLYFGNPDGFNLQNPTATNPAALMDMQNTSPFLYHLAASLDIFKLWVAILMGVGYASISKVSRKTACGVILGIYFVIQLAGAGLSAL